MNLLFKNQGDSTCPGSPRKPRPTDCWNQDAVTSGRGTSLHLLPSRALPNPQRRQPASPLSTWAGGWGSSDQRLLFSRMLLAKGGVPLLRVSVSIAPVGLVNKGPRWSLRKKVLPVAITTLSRGSFQSLPWLFCNSCRDWSSHGTRGSVL